MPECAWKADWLRMGFILSHFHYMRSFYTNIGGRDEIFRLAHCNRIAVSIFHHPKIVFLDEPTGGVDPATRRQFWELIYQAADQGITVFVTTHFMDEAEYCDRISIMVDGVIRALDTPGRLKQQFGAATMDDVFQQLAREAVRAAD